MSAMTAGGARLVWMTVICCAVTAHNAHAAGLAMPVPSLPMRGCECITGSATMIVARSRRIANRSRRIAVRLIHNPTGIVQIPETQPHGFFALRSARGTAFDLE